MHMRFILWILDITLTRRILNVLISLLELFEGRIKVLTSAR